MGQDENLSNKLILSPFFQQLLKASIPFPSEEIVVLVDKNTHEVISPVLPADWRVLFLPNNKEYIPLLQENLAQVTSGCIFLIPPLSTTHLRLKSHVEIIPASNYLSFIQILPHLSQFLQPQVSFATWFPITYSHASYSDKIFPGMFPRILVDGLRLPVVLGSKLPTLLPLRVLVLDKKADSPLVRFFQCPEVSLLVSFTGEQSPHLEREQAILKDLRKLLKKEGGATEFGYVLREGIPAGEPWAFERHHPRYKKQVEDLGIWGGVESLGQLVDIEYGFPLREQVNILLPAQDPAGVPVLQASHIGLDNKLRLEDIQHKAVTNKVEPYQLQVNDICLRADLASDGKIKAVKVEAHMLPLVPNETVLILRPKVERNVPIDFLLAYLQSGQILTHLKSAGVASRLYPSSLETLVVPMYDDEISQMVGELKEAAGVFGQWQEETQKVMHFLFTEQATKEVRGKFVTDGRVISQRVKIAQQISDLGYRLRAGLPHPLALRWRKAEIARPDVEGYEELLECAETILCYLALMSLPIMRAFNQSVGYLPTIAQRLTSEHKGTNLGDWVAIVREVCAKKAIKQMAHMPFLDLFNFLQDKKVDEAISLLSKNRNDKAHGRGPKTSHEYQEKFTESREALLCLLQAIEFLTEYPLIYIESTKRDSLTGVTSYQYLSLMGDHALVSSQTGETVLADLEAESLYLRDKRGNFYLLRPFLLRLEQKNGQWGTFFIDTYTTEKKCQFKSLEDGRVEMVPKIEPVLKHVGLLG